MIARIRISDVNKMKQHVNSQKSRETSDKKWIEKNYQKKLIDIGSQLANSQIVLHRLLLYAMKHPSMQLDFVIYMEPKAMVAAKQINIYCELAEETIPHGLQYLKERLPKCM